jgi:hypothetical protein
MTIISLTVVTMVTHHAKKNKFTLCIPETMVSISVCIHAAHSIFVSFDLPNFRRSNLVLTILDARKSGRTSMTSLLQHGETITQLRVAQ